jgi:hypothetical protein
MIRQWMLALLTKDQSGCCGTLPAAYSLTGVRQHYFRGTSPVTR